MNLAILLLAIVTVHQASCASSHPDTFLNRVLKRSAADTKRQVNVQQGQCVSEKVAEEFHGSQCALAENVVIDSPNGTIIHSANNEAHELFCMPECGNTLLQIYRECGTFNEFPGLYDYVIGLCATNSNGDRCYEHTVANFRHLITTETSCSGTYERTGRCTCRSVLTSAVKEMGCCINVLQDFYESISSNLDNSNLYRACGVSIPGDCNNSPIGSPIGSSSAGSPLGLSLAGLISTVLLSVLDNS